MSDREISKTELEEKLASLKGMPISHPWKGYGSTIFLELGRLTKPTSKKGVNDSGECCISIDWNWRVEGKQHVLFGSSNSMPKISKGLETLQGLKIADISISGNIPELTVTFSNGYCLRSMAMVTGDPEWKIRFSENNYIYARQGALFIGIGQTSSMSDEEEAVFSRAREAAYRWGEKSV